MSARFAGLAFFALAAVVSASPVPCETTTVTVWAPLPTIPGEPSEPITSLPLPTSTPGLPPISTVDPTSVVPTVLPTIPPVLPPVPTISVPTVSIPSISVPTIPIISVPTTSVPTISVPSISIPSISVPTITVPSITVPSITVPSITLPTITLPTGSGASTWGNAPTDTSSAASSAPTAPSGGGQCNTGALKCCNTVAQSGTPEGQKDILDALNSLGSPASSGLLSGLLGVLVDGVNAAVGINCSPITVLGIVGSSSCNAHPVCCEDNSHGSLISIGCIPITL